MISLEPEGANGLSQDHGDPASTGTSGEVHQSSRLHGSAGLNGKDKAMEAIVQSFCTNDGKGEERRGSMFAQRQSGIDFIKTFYGSIHDEDLLSIPPTDLALAAQEMWLFAQTVTSGEPKVRVYSPSEEKFKWGKDHTVVECVQADVPFLVSTLMAAIDTFEGEVALIAHPRLQVSRDASGSLHSAFSSSGHYESFIQIRLRKIDDSSTVEKLREHIRLCLRDVALVAADRSAISERIHNAVAAMEDNVPPETSLDVVSEASAFLHWLLRGHFIFMGARDLVLQSGRDGDVLVPSGGNLGILRDPETQVLRRGNHLVSMTPEVMEFMSHPNPLIISKANVRSKVHRAVHLDYVGVKIYDDLGALKGELRLVGLFTSSVYFASVMRIPVLRRKVAEVMKIANVQERTYSGRSLLRVLETYPRDDMFQIDVSELVKTALGVLSLQERPRTRVFVRRDKFDRFVSALVYLPKRHFTTDLVDKVGKILSNAYKGHISLALPSVPEGPLAMVHYIVGRRNGATPNPDHNVIESRIEQLFETWGDLFAECMATNWQGPDGNALAARYARSFSVAYESTFRPEQAVEDIAYLERLSNDIPLVVRIHKVVSDAGEENIHLRMYSHGEPIPLAERLPILENLSIYAVSEQTYEIAGQIDSERCVFWLHDITLGNDKEDFASILSAADRLEEAIVSIWNGWNDNDLYNRLVTAAGLIWPQVLIFRAVGNYLQQLRVPFTQRYVCEALETHGGIVALMMELFQARFDGHHPFDHKDRVSAIASIDAQIESLLERVSVLDEDRILRAFRDVISAMVRTNVYNLSEQDIINGRAMSFKINSQSLSLVPEPRPYHEIFVMSSEVMGIHLRGGAVARGGLRWSDRPQDFRTEILGLAKAQQVKNSVIVPVGAKGGFVVKNLPSMDNRDAFIQAGIAAYKRFISALLEVTDNVKKGKIVPADDMIRHDGDDPYLVVAADKGTASFSDIANEIAVERGFWLDDAFASGGSAGYDHKAMGITARGAWEAVKRHFREMDFDIQSQNFTTVGVGDMSGDVFGNGMLLSRRTRLVAAFNHSHIFIDPDPDADRSFAERRRLFELPGSSWSDYDATIISPGGGVFSRLEKSIELSDEVKVLTGLKADRVAPNEVIRALLRAQVDLIWFGGIGTYVRSHDETDGDVGDRANDALRICGRELRAKVIGEGANLGITQRGRIEFCRHGGRINTDFIDNAAGVNTSDVEVNIKIALTPKEKDGSIDRTTRNKLLHEMTNDVSALVLRSNYDQTLALTLLEREAMAQRTSLVRFIRDLEKRGLLNRAVEFLPDDGELAQREEDSLTFNRPELAVILAYAKNVMLQSVVDSNLPDDPFFEKRLIEYFPQGVRSVAKDAIMSHKLRREIIATVVANQVVNWCGPQFVSRLCSEIGYSLEQVVASVVAGFDSFDIADLMSRIDDLDSKVPTSLQLELYDRVRKFLRQVTVWFCRRPGIVAGDLSKVVSPLPKSIDRLRRWFNLSTERSNDSTFNSMVSRFTEAGVPSSLASSIAELDDMRLALDIIALAGNDLHALEQIAAIHVAIGTRMRISWLANQTHPERAKDHYEQLALNRASVSLYAGLSRITSSIVGKGGAPEAAFKVWLKKSEQQLKFVENAIDEAYTLHDLSFARLTIILAHMHELAADL